MAATRIPLLALAVTTLAGCVAAPLGPEYAYGPSEPQWVGAVPIERYETIPPSPYVGGIWIGRAAGSKSVGVGLGAPAAGFRRVTATPAIPDTGMVAAPPGIATAGLTTIHVSCPLRRHRSRDVPAATATQT
jgi:hypothetical protein